MKLTAVMAASPRDAAVRSLDQNRVPQVEERASHSVSPDPPAGAGGRFAAASDEAMTEDRGFELYWPVDDVEAAFHDLSQRAEICMPLKKLPFGTVFGIEDPGGQSQFLIEFSKNRSSVMR